MVVVIVEAMDPTAPGIGGGEAYSRNLVEYLLKTGIRTIFIGASSSNRRYTRDGLSFFPAVNSTSCSNLGYVLRLVTSRAFAIVPRGAIINVQRPEYALPFVLFCHRKNPKVITLHGKILHGVRLKQPRVKATLYRMVESLCLKRCTAVIAVDEGTRGFYEREYPWLTSKVHVIPVGIDLAKFKLLDGDGLRAKWGFRDGERIVMFVGRLEVEKDLGFLIESFRLVLRLVPEARLVFVGDGRDRNRLEDMARDLKPEKVLFMGAQKPGSMPEILNCGDVLALCSLYEGSPTVVKEALACGLPVVTTPVGDVAEVIKSNLVGRIVPKDADQYSRAIAEFLSREDREGARRECAKAASEFASDHTGARTVKLYEGLFS